jgi:hypothetical protein
VLLSGVPFIGKNIVGRIEAPSILDVVSLSVERDVLSSAIIYDRPLLFCNTIRNK